MAERTELDKGQQRELLATLAELAGGRFDPEDDIRREGSTLIVPESMSLESARDFIDGRITADGELVAFGRTFPFRPWDGAVCTWRTLRRLFGGVGLKGTRGFFGPEPPQLVEIPTGPGGAVESVPWGRFVVPGIPNGSIEPGTTSDPELGDLFRLTVNAPRRYRAEVEGLFVAVGAELASASIYRGKAFDGRDMPEFFDPFGLDPASVVYSADTLAHLSANVWTVLEHRAELERAGITRKRAALLFGPYGTGKSLAGMLTAQRAVANGWTFLMVRPGKDDIGRVMATARLYQPAVVFVEDLDTVADPEGNDSNGAARLLDLFDGITAKGTELMVVLTTNHPERIHRGMLRPGRLDAVIEIGELDAEGTERLYRATLPADVLGSIDWAAVYVATTGFLPAFIREAADRAFRYALARGELVESMRLETSDLTAAAEGLRPQLRMLDGASDAVAAGGLDAAMRRLAEEAAVRVVHPGMLDLERVDPADLERVKARD